MPPGLSCKSIGNNSDTENSVILFPEWEIVSLRVLELGFSWSQSGMERAGAAPGVFTEEDL